MSHLMTAGAASLGAATLLCLAACSPGGSTIGPPAAYPPAPSESSVSTAPADPSVTPMSPAATPTVGEPTPEAASPYRRLRGGFEGVPVVAEVFPIRREGATSTVNVRFVAKGTSRTFRIVESLSDHNPELGDKGKAAPDGLRLIDPAAKKAYLPATIGDRECVCSPAHNSWTDRYTDVTVSVTFAAPPASRDTIDLLVPGFGTVNDVPLQ